jgi:hypothetical protein
MNGIYKITGITCLIIICNNIHKSGKNLINNSKNTLRFQRLVDKSGLYSTFRKCVKAMFFRKCASPELGHYSSET